MYSFTCLLKIILTLTFFPCPVSQIFLLFWLDSLFCLGVAMENILWSKVKAASLSGIPPGERGDAL